MKERVFMSIDKEGINTPAYYETEGKNNNLLIRSLSDSFMCGIFINGISCYVNQTTPVSGLTLIDVKQTDSRTFETLRIHQTKLTNDAEASAAINWINTSSPGDAILFCVNTDVNSNTMFSNFMRQRGAVNYQNYSNAGVDFRFVGVLNSKNKKFVSSQAKTSDMGDTQLDIMFNTLDDIGQGGYGQSIVEQTQETQSETNPVILYNFTRLSDINVYTGESLYFQCEFYRDAISTTNNTTCDLYIMFHDANQNIVSSDFITPNIWKENNWVTVNKNIQIPSNAIGLSVRLIRRTPNTNKTGMASVRNVVLGTSINLLESSNQIQGTVIPYGLSSKALNEEKLSDGISVILGTDKITTKRLSLLREYSAMLLNEKSAIMPKFSANNFYVVSDISWNYRKVNIYGTTNLGIKIVNHAYVMMYSGVEYSTNKQVIYGEPIRHQIVVNGNNIKFVVDGDTVVDATVSNKITSFENYIVGGSNCNCVLYMIGFYDTDDVENNITYDVTNQYVARLRDQNLVFGFTLGSGIKKTTSTTITNGHITVPDSSLYDNVTVNITSVGSGALTNGLVLNRKYVGFINESNNVVINGTDIVATGNTSTSNVFLEYTENPDIHLRYDDNSWTTLNEKSFLFENNRIKFKSVFTNNTIVTFSFIIPFEHYNKNQTLIDLRTSTSQTNNRLRIENGVLISDNIKLNYLNRPLNNVTSMPIYPDVPYYVAVTLPNGVFFDKLGTTFNESTNFFGKLWNIGITSKVIIDDMYYANEFRRFDDLTTNVIPNINSKQRFVEHNDLTSYTMTNATRVNNRTFKLTSSSCVVKKQMLSMDGKNNDLMFSIHCSNPNANITVRHSRVDLLTFKRYGVGRFGFTHVTNTPRDIEIAVSGASTNDEVTIEYMRLIEESDSAIVLGDNVNERFMDFVYATSHISSQTKHAIMSRKIVGKTNMRSTRAERFVGNYKILSPENLNKLEIIRIQNSTFEMYIQNNNLVLKKGASQLITPIVNHNKLQLTSFRVGLLYDSKTNTTTISCGSNNTSGSLLSQTDFYEQYGGNVLEAQAVETFHNTIISGHHYNFVTSYYGDKTKETGSVFIKNELRLNRRLVPSLQDDVNGFELGKFGKILDVVEIANTNIFGLKSSTISGYSLILSINKDVLSGEFDIELFNKQTQTFERFELVKITPSDYAAQSNNFVRDWIMSNDAQLFNIIERKHLDILTTEMSIVDF